MSKLQIILGTAAMAFLFNGCASNGNQDSTSGRLHEPETPVRDLVIPPLPGLGATPIVTRNSG